MDYNTLLKSFPGYQGWGSTEALADYAATKGAGKGGGGAGGASGGGSFDVSQIPSIAEYTDKAYAPADEALKNYVLAMKGARQPLDVYQELEGAAGLPQMKQTASTLRQQIGNLEDTIKRVEGNVDATTKDSYVTQGQRAGMIEARQKPLLRNLSDVTTGLGRIEQGITAASQDLGTKTNLYLQGQELQMKPYEVQVNALNDRAARAVSGFTADVQNKLSGLLANWNRQNALADREVEEAFELLKLEKNYQNELTKYTEASKQDLADYEAKKKIDLKYKPKDTPFTPANVAGYYNIGGDYYPAEQETIDDLWNIQY